MHARRPLLTAFAGLALAAGGLATTTLPAAAAEADININEIESSGGTPGDWVEILNTGTAAEDLSGWVIRDSSTGAPFATIPSGTVLAAGAYYVADEIPGGTGLGGGDAVRLIPDGSTTPIDEYTWVAHAVGTTYGRCPNGTGDFVTTTSVTKGAVNDCATPAVDGGDPWPGDAGVRQVDPVDLFTGDLSGLAYEGSGSAAPGTLWAVVNGAGTLHQLRRSGTTWRPAPGSGGATGINLNYPGGAGAPDSEGLTLTDAGAAGGIFVSTERNNDAGGVSKLSVLRFDPTSGATSLNATREWDLTADLPVVGPNLGLEGIAWVPDSALVAAGFLDDTGAPYVPASYPGHGTGLFFVGVEGTGAIHAYALDQSSGAFDRVVTVTAAVTGLESVMDLSWEAETQRLWVVCDDTCDGRSTTLGIDTAAGSANRGKLVAGPLLQRPGGMANLNNEGFATTPRSECVDGLKPVYWADDGDTPSEASDTVGFSLREGTLTCTPLPVTPAPATPAPPAAVDRVPPTVRITGFKAGRTYAKKRTPRCVATDASGVQSCTLKTTKKRKGTKFTVVATAVDNAGNVATTRKSYKVDRRR